jgi:hypothetical protein
MLKRTQLKNKWDKLKNDLSVWRKLMRKQTGTGWSWSTGSINMDAEWWKKIKSVSTLLSFIVFFVIIHLLIVNLIM